MKKIKTIKKYRQGKGFGTIQYKIWITFSEISKNYLLMVNKTVFESACELEDIQTIRKWLNEKLKANPFPQKIDPFTIKEWIVENAQDCPIVEKYAFVKGIHTKIKMHIIKKAILVENYVLSKYKKITGKDYKITSNNQV